MQKVYYYSTIILPTRRKNMQNYWLSDVNYQKSFIKRIRESAEKMADGSVDIPAAEKEYAEAMLGIVAKTDASMAKQYISSTTGLAI